MTESGLIKLLQNEIKRTGTQAETAKKLGISAQFLSDLLQGRRGPGDDLLAKLGLYRVIEYHRVKES